MPSRNRVLQGGRTVAGNALNPRTRRDGTKQAATYWSGISGGGTNAIGGIGPSKSTGGGYRYLEFNSTGALTVTGAGTFEFYIFGGGGGGSQGNGYNGFAQGGFGASGVQVTKTLSAGTYTVTVGALGAGATGYGSPSAGGDSYFDTDITNKSTGGAGGVSGGGGLQNINGAAGTDVSTFIGGASLFKGAGGGNPASGNGGSSIGGNGRTYPSGGTSAAANTASGGGGSNGSGLPDFFIQNGGSGGSGIVYVRWRA